MNVIDLQKPAHIQCMECSPEPATTAVTMVTLTATYVCTTQFHVISRHAHTGGVERNRDCAVKWVEAKTEVGQCKPDQLVT